MNPVAFTMIVKQNNIKQEKNAIEHNQYAYKIIVK